MPHFISSLINNSLPVVFDCFKSATMCSLGHVFLCSSWEFLCQIPGMNASAGPFRNTFLILPETVKLLSKMVVHSHQHHECSCFPIFSNTWYLLFNLKNIWQSKRYETNDLSKNVKRIMSHHAIPTPNPSGVLTYKIKSTLKKKRHSLLKLYMAWLLPKSPLFPSAISFTSDAGIILGPFLFLKPAKVWPAFKS